MTASQEDLFFASYSNRFGVFIPKEQIQRMRQLCENAGRLETGGILIGYYTDDMHTAVVTEVTGAPEDSSAGFARFYRGVKGLKRYLKEIWKHRNHYYLGEWHFHPYAAPIPSDTDKTQMRSITASAEYHCPEPVLMILGGDPKACWKISAHLFVHNEMEENLQEAEVSAHDFRPVSSIQTLPINREKSKTSKAKPKR